MFSDIFPAGASRKMVFDRRRRKCSAERNREMKKIIEGILEFYWVIAMGFFMIGFLDVVVVVRMMGSKALLIPGVIVFGVGFLMLMIPLMGGLIGSFFDRY